MFDGCSKLKKLNFYKWDVSRFREIKSLFKNCSILEDLQLTNWNVVNVTDMSDMFTGCTALTKLILGPYIPISKLQSDGGLEGTWTGGPETGYVYTKPSA